MNTQKDRRNLLRIMDALIESGGAHDITFAESAVPPPPDASCQPWNRLSLVVDGCVCVTLVQNGKNTILTERRGHAIFYPPQCWNLHLYPATFQLFGIVFRDGYLRFLHSDKQAIGAGMRLSGFRYHTSGPLSAQGRHVLNALQHLAESHGDRTTGCLLFNALLRLCREELAGDMPRKPDRARQTFHQVCDYLQDHFHERINREAVAQSLQLHPNYLSRLFMEHSGETFVQRLRKLRLGRATALLVDSTFRVEDVAARAGFGDLPHFFRVFHDTYGMSPAQYRQRAATAGRTTPKRRVETGKRTGGT